MKTTKTVLAAPEDGKAGDPSITVRCPNPACGKTYALKSSLAGKNIRCLCGTVFRFPSACPPRSGDLPPPPAPAQQPGEKGAIERRREEHRGAGP